MSLGQETANPKIEMVTSKGRMVIELYPDKAPMTVKNFLRYVDSGFYDGTIFHRVMKDFMIQGGGHNPDMSEKTTGEPIRNEADNRLSNRRGTIAMGRLEDPHSATSQFYINTVANPGLNFRSRNGTEWGYCVFGKVIEGMDVVDAIANVRIMTRQGHRNVPRENIIITSVKRL
ncbi:peptidylprolyl isomerase [Acidobacteriota bacterium]